MASVWVARLVRKHGFEKLVAIKTILPKYAEDETFQKMFFDEARIASRIDHVNVGHIHDLGEEDNILYLVMEWIDGDALTRLRRSIIKAGKPFPVDIALRIIADVLAGLHAAHELRGNDGAPLGVVHRDVSPQNILVTIEGVAKLIDFGVAKARDRLVEETNTGFVKGKVQYMAPEQALGKIVDRRADLWAVGAVLYHLMAGKPPFDADNQLAMLHVLTSGKKPAPLPQTIPTKVIEVIQRALTHDVEERFQSASEMKNAIERTGLAATTDQVAECLRTFLGEQAEARRHALSVALHTADTRASLVASASVSGVRGVPAATTGSDSGTRPPIHPVVTPGSQPPGAEDGSLSARSTQPISTRDRPSPPPPTELSSPSILSIAEELPPMRKEAGSDPTIDKAAPGGPAAGPPTPPRPGSAPSAPRLPPPLPSSRPKIPSMADAGAAAAGNSTVAISSPPVKAPSSSPKLGARPAPPPPPPPPSDPMTGSKPPPMGVTPSSPSVIAASRQSSPFIPVAAPVPQVPGMPASTPSQPAAVQASGSGRPQSQSEISPTVPLPPLNGSDLQDQVFDRTELMITPPLNPPPTPAGPATGGESLGLASISSSVAMPKPRPRRALLIGGIVGGFLLISAIVTTITLSRINFGKQPAFTPAFSPLPPPPPPPSGVEAPPDPAPTTTTTATPSAAAPTTTTTTTTTAHKPPITNPPPARTGGGPASSTKRVPVGPGPASSRRNVDDGF